MLAMTAASWFGSGTAISSAYATTADRPVVAPISLQREMVSGIDLPRPFHNTS